ncbi:MAG: HNH endonuclease [Bdellovibrionales bacterium]
MTKLSSKQHLFHSRVLKYGKLHSKIEQRLIENLIGVEESGAQKALGIPSMFQYAMDYLNVTKSTAYGLITVARKSREIPELRKALAQQKLSVAKASRIVAHLDNKNAKEMIEFAIGHTFDEIDYEVARRNPKAKKPDKVKVLTEDQFEITLTVSKETIVELRRIQSLLAQKGKPATLSDAVSASTPYFLSAEDPVKKAERHAKRAEKAEGPKSETPHRNDELCAHRVQKLTLKERIPLTAGERHAVILRDKGRCTHKNHAGKRCNSDRWVDIHHIIEVSKGGTNHPDNLITLCSFHHDLVHQLSFPIEGQINWIRQRGVAYRKSAPARQAPILGSRA